MGRTVRASCRAIPVRRVAPSSEVFGFANVLAVFRAGVSPNSLPIRSCCVGRHPRSLWSGAKGAGLCSVNDLREGEMEICGTAERRRATGVRVGAGEQAKAGRDSGVGTSKTVEAEQE